MKKFISVSVAFILFTLGVAALAQDAPDTTEYRFDDDVVQGDLISPDGIVLVGRKKDASGSLVKVRKHFVPEMLKSVERI
ncbi:MAG: hypothetical protein JXX14_02815 [Deltaproteobacteria bacterium]|nr:hypothetical protein [Deltaproteobacteria bacterium]